MKLTIINQEPIYVDDRRGQSIKQALMGGVEFIEIDGNLYRTSTITAVTDENEPATMWNYVPENRRLDEPEHVTAAVNSDSLKRFKKMRQKFGL